MSDLPFVDAPVHLSHRERRHAALTVVECTNYEKEPSISYLLMLGLIQTAGGGYEPTATSDAEPWDINALTTHWM